MHWSLFKYIGLFSQAYFSFHRRTSLFQHSFLVSFQCIGLFLNTQVSFKHNQASGLSFFSWTYLSFLLLFSRSLFDTQVCFLGLFPIHQSPFYLSSHVHTSLFQVSFLGLFSTHKLFFSTQVLFSQEYVSFLGLFSRSPFQFSFLGLPSIHRSLLYISFQHIGPLFRSLFQVFFQHIGPLFRSLFQVSYLGLFSTHQSISLYLCFTTNRSNHKIHCTPRYFPCMQVSFRRHTSLFQVLFLGLFSRSLFQVSVLGLCSRSLSYLSFQEVTFQHQVSFQDFSRLFRTLFYVSFQETGLFLCLFSKYTCLYTSALQPSGPTKRATAHHDISHVCRSHFIDTRLFSRSLFQVPFLGLFSRSLFRT